MADKTILNADLYDNVLTEKKGDYTAKPRITGTLHNREIAERIVKERTEYRPETIENILNLADQKKAEAIAAGKSVVDGVGQYLLNLKGPFDGEKPVFNPEVNRIGITFTPGKSLLEQLGNITFNVSMATTGPVINTVTDVATGAVNETITPNNPINIAGSGLLLKGDDPTVGVFFTKDVEGATPVQGTVVSRNTKSEIIVQVPGNLADGQYRLSVTTQAGAGYTLLKQPRTYEFPILLTIPDDGPVVV